ncbi:MAG: transcription elongation factor GreB [Hydrogenophilales bacterium CG17_big_fil_post_rev_8_21_14_2_50_63_12]|nr:MAG: transcription elongation factor GreB [Hydrogenophilales bacterium CG17_big_fil_post_rev_8_21_14_2_50_63_12]PIX95812.1 MAG: transcription elongation factor GreB [Hydrogenophilales bacterium CG_4_10_14_3_um_filter_63_21]PJB07762.1 MAG: transcription elongation factor GreB [Hydrogenophilales bacterium CG_4_9_14_3_um_filter_63_34]
MSKAFVKDEAAADEDEEETGSPLPVGGNNYMTPAGHARLQAEFTHLVKVERPEVVSVVSWAAGNGDRSENGDYIYGKKRLREIDRRLRFLGKRLDHAVVVDPSTQENTDCVYFGASVSVLDQNGETFTYSIVGLDETDPGRGRISWVSPLARALLKARLGDSVRFQSPGGLRELEIVAIEYRTLD